MPIQNFAGHGVDGFGGFVAVLLRELCHGLTFGEETANDTVITFVRATLPRTVWVGIVDGETLVTLLVMFHAIAILKL